LRPIHILLVLSICVVWGANFVVTKLGLENFPPVFFSALRFALLVLVLFPFLKIVPGRMKRVLIFAFTLGVMHYSTMLIAIGLTGNMATLAILNQVYIPFGVILAVVFLKEQVGWKRWSGIALAFAGVMVMGFDPEVLRYTDSMIIVLISSLIIAVANVMARGLADISPFTLNAWVAAVAVLPLTGLSFLLEEGQIASLGNAGLGDWTAVAYNAFLVTLYGHGMVYILFRQYGVGQVTPWLLLMPFFAVGFSVAILGDILTLRILAGGAMILAGVAIVTFRSAGRAKVPPQPARP
jgi:O-acetylserine/cysteine efflux transporter